MFHPEILQNGSISKTERQKERTHPRGEAVRPEAFTTSAFERSDTQVRHAQTYTIYVRADVRGTVYKRHSKRTPTLHQKCTTAVLTIRFSTRKRVRGTHKSVYAETIVFGRTEHHAFALTSRVIRRPLLTADDDDDDGDQKRSQNRHRREHGVLKFPRRRARRVNQSTYRPYFLFIF